VLLKFALPTDDQIPWLLKETKDAEKLQLLLAPMSESRVFQAAKAPSKTVVPETKRKAAPKIKARAKAKSAASSSAQSADLHGKRKRDDDKDKGIEELSGSLTTADGAVRPTLFLDDLVHSIEYTIEHVAPKDRKADVVEYALRFGMELALCGVVSVALEPGSDKKGNKELIFKKWTSLRVWIKQMVRRAHSLAPRLSDPDALIPELSAGAGSRVMNRRAAPTYQLF